ncbi:hypothetical protein EVAR_447_1 [Eumeta japonica]|uniref:Uncharacterized protein n=1 Tax=Eumeta variegata TaxID=151549 RepID=A0A4C1SDE6_EUMVA|nr:hypothetical protein EVAR_447_1 [Eumeta japonica]
MRQSLSRTQALARNVATVQFLDLVKTVLLDCNGVPLKDLMDDSVILRASYDTCGSRAAGAAAAPAQDLPSGGARATLRSAQTSRRSDYDSGDIKSPLECYVYAYAVASGGCTRCYAALRAGRALPAAPHLTETLD